MNGFRLLRIILGLMLIIQALILKDWIFALAGFIFTALPIFNVGCFGNTSCKIPNQDKTGEPKKVEP
jgi:hypothetical protein